MAREPRKKLPDVKYHITTKGFRGTGIFKEEVMKDKMIETLHRAEKKFDFDLDAFCIMDNHIHLLLFPKQEEDLSQIMQWILTVFAMAYNQHVNQGGPVFNGRFWSKIIENKAQYFEVYRYIMKNPVKAGIVEKPLDYKYSSITFLANRSLDVFGIMKVSILEALAHYSSFFRYWMIALRDANVSSCSS